MKPISPFLFIFMSGVSLSLIITILITFFLTIEEPHQVMIYTDSFNEFWIEFILLVIYIIFLPKFLGFLIDTSIGVIKNANRTDYRKTK